MVLEIATFSTEAAIEAAKAGADRIELCSAFQASGLTPSAASIKLSCSLLKLPVFVMVRPREGDFLYNTREFEVLLHDLQIAIELGASGIVTGVLNRDGLPDYERLNQIRKAAEGIPLTFHRAFDLASSPIESMKIIIECGFDRILTSGQQPSAPDGLDLLKELNELAANRIIILPGGGINEKNIKNLLNAGCFNEIHMSARKGATSKRQNPTITGNLPATSELVNGSHIMPDASLIRRIKTLMKQTF